ncbi:hypothetical protein PhCBS80983_g03938 [Powellomyces hirtus]|uniref:Transmembrane protein 186 n=1 Tax=Powellomyces hirtus TaxID=109895 RepID=A0A507E2D8_9FUNG|nr:hypothetical protein PhCBS80983_g03938 [Powellomyces hirtus]
MHPNLLRTTAALRHTRARPCLAVQGLCRRSASSQIDESSLVYHGPLAKTLIYLKRVSATTFGLSTFAAPLLTVAEYSNLAVVGTMMGAAVVTSGLSTMLVQYCVNPYVTKVIFPPPSPTATSPLPNSTTNPVVVLETLTFFGNARYTAMNVSDLIPATDRAFANWRLRPGAASSDDSTAQALYAMLPKLPSKLGHKRTRFYVHPELDQGFEPRMAELVRAVNRAGRNGDAGNVAAGKSEPTGAGSRDWDEVVKGLREKK